MIYQEQGSQEWHVDRAGCFTASTMGDLAWERGKFVSGPRKGLDKPPPEARMAEIDRVVAEILTGSPKEEIRAKALDHGREMEPEAVALYEQRTKVLVEPCGFIRHKDFPFIGASPDFLVDPNGGGEVKCPFSKVVHARTLRCGLPPEHIEQIQAGLWVTGRMWWDFISYHAGFPAGLQLYVQRVKRDAEVIARIKADCLSAWEEVQTILADLHAREFAA